MLMKSLKGSKGRFDGFFLVGMLVAVIVNVDFVEAIGMKQDDSMCVYPNATLVVCEGAPETRDSVTGSRLEDGIGRHRRG